MWISLSVKTNFFQFFFVVSQIARVAGHPCATMNLYTSLVSLHVIAAIFGLGPLAALALATARTSAVPIPAERLLERLRLVRWGLAAMFISGAGIIALTHGALGETTWMRVSFGLFVVLGALHGITSRKARQVNGDTTVPKSVSALLWSMCAVIVLITYLMEAKPW